MEYRTRNSNVSDPIGQQAVRYLSSMDWFSSLSRLAEADWYRCTSSMAPSARGTCTVRTCMPFSDTCTACWALTNELKDSLSDAIWALPASSSWIHVWAKGNTLGMLKKKAIADEARE